MDVGKLCFVCSMVTVMVVDLRQLFREAVGKGDPRILEVFLVMLVNTSLSPQSSSLWL